MPLYGFKCEQCEHEFDELMSIAEYSARQNCPKCSKTAFRHYKSADRGESFTNKLYPYHDFSLNKTFNSPSERKSYLKKNNLQQAETKSGMNRAAEKLMYSWRLGHFDKRKLKYT